jgi:type II secretory pathway pseudopilin PulG
MTSTNNINGFTLLELLIAALLTIVISTAALSFFVRSNQQYFSQEDISETQQCLRASTQEIIKQIRMAGFNIPDSINAIEIDSIMGAPDTITVHRDTFEIRFYVDNSGDSLHPNLIKEVNGTTSIFATDISNLSASRLSAKSIRISVTAKSSKTDDQIMNGNKMTRSETQVVNLRNVR